MRDIKYSGGLRLAESTFKVITTNVTDGAGMPFPGTSPSAVALIRTGGRVVRVGLYLGLA